MPPEVEPEHPPKARMNKNIIEAKGFHKVKSSSAYPVVEITEITLKNDTLNAFSRSYPLVSISEVATATDTQIISKRNPLTC